MKCKNLSVSVQFLLCFLFEFEGNFQVQAPGGLYLEGDLTEGFFAVRDCWAYIWRG